MIQSVMWKFRASCMMLMRREGRQVVYLGTAFVVHRDGYLLTVASLIPEQVGEGELVVAPPALEQAFQPITQETVAPLRVVVAQIDRENDVALLRFDPPLEVVVPDRIIGNPEVYFDGSSLMVLGYAFAHYRIHNPIARHAVISARVQAPNGTNLMLVDQRVHDGDVGGLLVCVQDERVIGLVQRRFDPTDLRKEEHDDGVQVVTVMSQGVSIEYGAALMKEEGLTIT